MTIYFLDKVWMILRHNLMHDDIYELKKLIVNEQFQIKLGPAWFNDNNDKVLISWITVYT